VPHLQIVIAGTRPGRAAEERAGLPAPRRAVQARRLRLLRGKSPRAPARSSSSSRSSRAAAAAVL